MRYAIFFVAASLAAQPTITDIRATQNRAVITVDDGGNNYAAGLCTIRVCETNTGTCTVGDTNLVSDVKTSVFSGSNTDNRTVSWNSQNRTTNVVNGRQHIFVTGTPIAGWDVASAPSRALVAATRHVAIANCPSGDSAAVGFSTGTIPIGQSYPNWVPFDARAPWNNAYPKIDQNAANRNTRYVNPVSGVAEFMVSYRTDHAYTSGPAVFGQAFNDSGNSWTNIAKLKDGVNTTPGASTTTTGQSHAAFLEWNDGSGGSSLNNFFCHPGQGYYGNCPMFNTDPQLHGHSIGPGSSVIAVCLANDNTGCSATALTGTVTAGGDVTIRLNSSFPGGAGYFDGWTPSTTLDVIRMVNTGGYFVWLVSGPGVVLNVQYWEQGGTNFISLGPPNGAISFCGPATTDPNGDTAYVCANEGGQGAANNQAAWSVTPSPAAHPSIPSHALLSVLYDTNGSHQYMGIVDGSFDFIGGNGRQLLAIGGTDGHLYSGVFSDLAPYTPGTGGTPPADHITWTQIDSGASITTQVSTSSATGNRAKSWYNTGIFSPFTLTGFVAGAPFYRAFPTDSNQDRPCLFAFADSSNNLTYSGAAFSANGTHWGLCHGGALSVGQYAFISMDAEGVSFPGFGYDNTYTRLLTGPYELNVTQYKVGNTWHDYTVALGATGTWTSGSTTTITATANNLETVHQPTVNISGAVGTCTGLNGVWKVTASTNSFVVGFNSTSVTLSDCTITVKTSRPFVQSAVTNITNASPPVATTGWAHQLINGDPIGFGGLANTAQYYAKTTGCAGCDSTHFAIYSDAALTTPAVYASVSAANNGTVYFAEVCPSATAPPFDVNPVGQVRCRTIRVAEPASWWASSTEHSAFPPLWSTGISGNDSHMATLQPIQVGDMVYDTSATDGSRGNDAYNGNQQIIIASTFNSNSDVEITMVSFSGYLAGGAGTGFPFSYLTDSRSLNLNTDYPGWQPTMQPNGGPHNTVFVSALDPLSTAFLVDPALGGNHADIFGSTASMRYSDLGPNLCDPIGPLPFSTFLNTFCTKKGLFTQSWMGGGSSQQLANQESYPSVRANNAPLPEQVWDTNVASILAGNAGTQLGNGGQGENIYSVTAPVLQGGTSGVYLVTPGTTVTSGTVENLYKTWPFQAIGGWYNWLDISGPSSSITDATPYTFCVALAANQCRSGSSKGNIYMSVPPQVAPATVAATGDCHTNTVGYITPCIHGAGSLSGWARQWQTSPISGQQRFRKITTGFTAPAGVMDYAAFPTDSTGQFGAYPVCFPDYNFNCAYFQSKLPPWPGNGFGADIIDRTRYYKLTLSAGGSTNEEYQFGYLEYGNSTDFFCTPYSDICTTRIPTATSDPFGFVTTDSASLPTTTGPHTINAISGRVLYYRYHDLVTGAVGPTQVFAVP